MVSDMPLLRRDGTRYCGFETMSGLLYLVERLYYTGNFSLGKKKKYNGV